MIPTRRDLVFVSYSHWDKDWLERLRVFLKPYTRQGQLNVWADPYIKVGDRWQREIAAALQRTRIAVLLVSPDFLASDFIAEEELPAVLAAEQNGEAKVFCVPISHAPFRDTPLADFQWTSDPGSPLDTLREPERNRALVDLTYKIVETAPPVEMEEPDGIELKPIPDAPAKSRLAALHTTADGPLGKLYGVPSQRAHYVPRLGALDRLKAALLGTSHKAVGITGAGQEDTGHKVGLHGMGGIGKSVLAIALVHDGEVRRAFPDGIYWTTLGQSPDLIGLQAELIEHVSGSIPAIRSIDQGRGLLRKSFKDKSCLLVIDDLWQAHHGEVFDVLGPRSRFLTTTRDASLVTALGAHEMRLDVLSESQALDLLAEWSEVSRPDLPDSAADVAESCDRLPLALSLAGAQVRDGVPWDDLLTALEAGDLEFLDHPFGSVFKSMRLSVDALSDETRQRYLELAVFPEDVHIPEATVCTLWSHTGDLRNYQVRRLLHDLENKGLLYLSKEEDVVGVSFHDLQHDFVRLVLEDIRVHHDRLLAGYRNGLPVADEATTNPWALLPSDEPYLWTHIAYHLTEAGRGQELLHLLVDFDWLTAKLDATDVNALVGDFEYASESKDHGLLQQCLRLSAPVLAIHHRQLAAQLLGRLSPKDGLELAPLLATARRRAPRPALLPLRPTLTPPGAELRRFEGHEGWVKAVALSADGRRALTGSNDTTLRLWDLESGAELRRFEGHEGTVNAVALSADGRRALSGSLDKTLRLWDLESGAELRRFEGHEGTVNAVALSADGRRALSGSLDKTLRLWDLESGAELRRFEGHEGVVSAAALSADGRRALSGSEDRTLRLWDLESGAEIRRFEGHETGVTEVALSADGRRALSGSWDTTLRLWDLESGAELRRFEGHEGWARAVALSADGRRALSGSDDKTLRLWDLESGAELRRFEGHEKGHEGWVNAVALSADGRRALSGSWGTTLRLWDLESGAELRRFEGHEGWVNAVALSADGRRALTGSNDTTLRLRDLESGAELRRFEGHEGWVKAVALSADGRRALSGSDDKTLRLWDLESGAELRRFEGHEGVVTAVALSADGRRALSGSHDKTLRLWDLESGAERAAFYDDWAILCCAITRDEDRVVIGDAFGRIHVLEILESGQ